jgi:CHAT domain-containing protein
MSCRRALVAAGLVLALGGAAVASDSQPSEAESAFNAGQSALAAGRFAVAAEQLSRAARLFAERGRDTERLDSLLQLSQAQLALGALTEAEATLRNAMPLAERGTLAEQAAALAAAGSLRLARDEPQEAQRLLEDAASRAREAGDTRLALSVELNLGVLQASEGEPAAAAATLTAAAEQAEEAGEPALAAHALANAARSLARTEEVDESMALIDRAAKLANELPPSHEQATTLIHLAVTLRELAERAPHLRSAARPRALRMLTTARKAAASSGDARNEAESVAYLAELYEADGRFEEALLLNRQALAAAPGLHAPASRYRWEWQSARVLAALGRDDEAIAAYEQSVRTLSGIAPQALASRRNATSFRETVGPVYLGLVDLLLQRAASTSDASEALALRRRARDRLEQSKAAELRDYFRDDCVDSMRARVKAVGEVSSSAAIVYPIVLDDRLEILVQLPSGELRQLTVAVERATLEEELRSFRRLLTRRTTRQYLGPARRLHGWLVAPWEEAVREQGTDTLVFVPDGPLRSVPMAALHDGERFLVERFGVAVTPGLELTDPRPLDREKLEVLLGGVSQSVDGFPALEHVPEELRSVHAQVGGEVLLDESFRREALEAALAQENVGLVHLATHGEFAADLDESYLVTWDGRVSGRDLSATLGQLRFREDPVELLTLSACETARGSDRAALGLLGVAVQAGARSALGSLWKVEDQSTARLMASFYQGLVAQGLSRAEALRRAQRELLADPAFAHPLYWSGFVLINSWL